VAPFSGCEPLVGEIAGLRTFRVDEFGVLLPLYAREAWYDGTNTAVCAPPTGDGPRTAHAVVDPDCECGFYAYGTVEAAERNRNMRFVQAVVSCWGTVVAGTHGVRAEYARIDAVWLGPSVPPRLRRYVAQRYPSARLYTERAAMLAEHPLSTLPCYETPRRPPRISRVAPAVLGVALFALGLAPSAWLVGPVRDMWFAVTAATVLLATWLLACSHGRGHVAAAVLVGGVAAWLAAPAFGWAGWVLRLPVLRALLVGAGSYLLSLRPGYFPVVRTPRVRTFCGVRP
jgi:hypothetical protein